MRKYHIFGTADCPICKELFKLFEKAVASGRLDGEAKYRPLDDMDNLAEFAFLGNLNPPAVVVYDENDEMQFMAGDIVSLSAISMSDFEEPKDEETTKSTSV